MRYFSTQRPITPGSFPKDKEVEKIVNFDVKTFCTEIGREAWGYIEYKLALTREEADAYELTQGGMKFYYCVTTSIDDRGKITAAITNIVEAVHMPENRAVSLKRKDIYNDWFESREEAERSVEEARSA